jgi:hypothetical protein
MQMKSALQRDTGEKSVVPTVCSALGTESSASCISSYPAIIQFIPVKPKSDFIIRNIIVVVLSERRQLILLSIRSLQSQTQFA